MALMTTEELKQIISTQVPFKDLKKNGLINFKRGRGYSI